MAGLLDPYKLGRSDPAALSAEDRQAITAILGSYFAKDWAEGTLRELNPPRMVYYRDTAAPRGARFTGKKVTERDPQLGAILDILRFAPTRRSY